MRISDLSSDVCSSDLIIVAWGTMWLVRGHDLATGEATLGLGLAVIFGGIAGTVAAGAGGDARLRKWAGLPRLALFSVAMIAATLLAGPIFATSSLPVALVGLPLLVALVAAARSEEHTSELQSLMRISYAVFCLTKQINRNKHNKLQTNYKNQTNENRITQQ